MALRGFDALVARHVVGDDEFQEAPVDEMPPEVVVERAPGAPALVPFNLDPGDDLPAATPLIKSEIVGIPDEKWTDFVKAMRTAQTGSVSASNQLGAFEMRPRRLEDIGLMKKGTVRCMRSPQGMLAWLGDWVPPLTQELFLTSPRAQYLAFAASMRRYVEGLRSGVIKRPKGGVMKGMTLSALLGVLHRCGPQGLAKWNDPEARFENTLALVNEVNGIF